MYIVVADKIDVDVDVDKASTVGIHSVSCDTAVYVPGQVGEQPVDMLVDTGSAVTLVYFCVLQNAKREFKLERVSDPVVSANGQPLDIRGKCVLEISLGGVTVSHPVLVAADVTQDCLLARHEKSPLPRIKCVVKGFVKATFARV